MPLLTYTPMNGRPLHAAGPSRPGHFTLGSTPGGRPARIPFVNLYALVPNYAGRHRLRTGA
jgi:hypothetical protein